MSRVEASAGNPLSPVQAVRIMVGLGLVLLAQVNYTKSKLVKSSQDFLITGRILGLDLVLLTYCQAGPG